MRGESIMDKLIPIKITKKQYEILEKKRKEIFMKTDKLPAFHEVLNLVTW